MARKLSTLTDFFDGAAINTAVWNTSGTLPDVTLDTALDRVRLACQVSYPTLGTSGPFDAVDSALYARVTPAPVGSGTTQTIMRVGLNSTNRASFYTDGGVLSARVLNAGVASDVTVGTYNPYEHAWWRIRESGGSILFDTSRDGWTWTNRAIIAYTWSAAAVTASFLCGYYGTEAAGMAAYVDHVNTTVSAPDQPNLAWPLIEDAWGAYWGANQGTQPLDRYVEVSNRTEGTLSVQRGRQYETDQVRAGEASLSLANKDAAFDPLNTAGPWHGHIAPYQPYRRRAQWPPTRNVLDQVMATGGDLGGFTGAISSATSDIFTDTDSSGGTFTTSATAWQGTSVMQFAVPSGTAAPARVCHTPRWSARPGQTYTMQMRVRDVTASTTLSVQPLIGWYTAGGGDNPTSYTYGTTSVLTGATTAGWTTITVTATAPANAAGMDVGVALAATAAATASVQVDGWQLEKGATPTTWQVPGVWFPVYAGWTERWPSTWNMSGTYGMVSPTAVDTFSLLSQQTLTDALTHEINSHTPRFLYRLDDPAGSAAASDATGTFTEGAQIVVSKYGAGTLTFGNSIASTGANGTYTGSSGTVARFSNPNPGVTTGDQAGSYLSLSSAGITGPANPATFSRMIAFRYTGPTPSAGATAVIWTANSATSGANMRLEVTANGGLQFWIVGPDGTSVNQAFLNVPFTYPVNDGNWHLAFVCWDASTGMVRWSVDDHTMQSSGGAIAAATPTGLTGDYLGGLLSDGTKTARSNYVGDLSFVAEFPTLLSAADISNVYAAWKRACAGESTDARYARILRYAGFTGATVIQPGLTTSMGPANIDGQDAVSALQRVVDTENGAHFVDRAGAIRFVARSARYNALTPVVTFGERADLGELPYENCAFDYDSTHLSNTVKVTQESTGQVFYANDEASVAAFFARPMERTLNTSSADECSDAANYLNSRYRQPAQRVSSLKLHPSANPALWAACLAMELGTRVRVMRRPPGVPAVTIECFVEKMSWTFEDNGEAWLELQCSPADLTPYGMFATWHTTLASSISAGVSTITVNASQDNVNPLATQLAPGQQLVLGQGTANAETVTVLTVGATSPGWTTAVITLTANTTAAHTVNDTVCEPLPAGTTDPTTWDAASAFDAVAFAY